MALMNFVDKQAFHVGYGSGSKQAKQRAGGYTSKRQRFFYLQGRSAAKRGAAAAASYDTARHAWDENSIHVSEDGTISGDAQAFIDDVDALDEVIRDADVDDEAESDVEASMDDAEDEAEQDDEAEDVDGFDYDTWQDEADEQP
ncbi:MAG: hypothetical protein AAGI46_04520 [Planctomycetota bacterium]